MAQDVSRAFGTRLFCRHMRPTPEHLLRPKTQPYNVLRHASDSGKAAVSAFVDEVQPPIILLTAARKTRESSGYVAATVSSLTSKAVAHTGAVYAATVEAREDNGRYSRAHFPWLLTLRPVVLDMGTCVRTAMGGDHRRNQGADRSSIWYHWREAFLVRDHVSGRCHENSLLLLLSVFRFPEVSQPALVVPDDDMTRHGALEEGAVRNGSTRNPRATPLSSDDSGAPGASMPGTMSGTSRC